MDGVLVVDKPSGITSHDAVEVVRRATRFARIGHTGTLDPLATGVLPLACGKATRLVRFLTASDKAYRATIRFGLTTDTLDITGTVVSQTEAVPSIEAVTEAMAALVGKGWQVPPAYSAKKVAGRRAYELARAAQPVDLPPVQVEIMHATLVAFDGRSAVVELACSAGFYVRAFAHTVGERVGTGACLEALRRTRSGDFDEAAAVALDDIRRDPSVALLRLLPIGRLLQTWPSVEIDDSARQRVCHGQSIREPADLANAENDWVRLIDESGHIVALARRNTPPGVLHPAVVLV